MKINFEQFLALLEIVAWPIVVLVAFLFFKKMLTYLFFSMEEFNFFGAKGRLKNVQEMIREKAQELFDRERQEKEAREKEQRLKKDIEKLKSERIASIKEWRDLTNETFNEYKEVNDKYLKLLEKNTQLQNQVAALLAQIQQLQALIGEGTKGRFVKSYSTMKSCPICGNPKFYFGEYHQNAFPEAYAMCKWCGYWKKEGEEAKQCKMFFCGCSGSIRDRSGYDWGLADQVACQSCGKTLTEKDQVKWPADDQSHPFHRL